MLSCGVKKDPSYTINAHLTGFEDSTKFYLKSFTDDVIIDSTHLVDGHLHFSGKLQKVPQSLSLKSGKGYSFTALYMGNEEVVLKGDKKDFPYHLLIETKKTGFAWQKKLLDDQMKDLHQQRLDTLTKYAYNPNSENPMEAVILGRKQTRGIDAAMDSIEYQYILDHPDFEYAMQQLYFRRSQFGKEKLQALYEQFSPEVQQSSTGEKLKFYVNHKIPEIGDDYYDFTALNQEKDSVQFSSYLGKYVLLEFTSNSCLPCILALPDLESITQTYADSLTVVSFQIDKSESDLLKLLGRHEGTWPVLWSGEGADDLIQRTYGVQGVPAFFLLSPKGKVIDKWSGYGEGSLISRMKKNFPESKEELMARE
ncbi:hypothetical protein GCM10023331_05700 [Algivirga pacifica]|uniref:Thioredoxin domain-containing protein n=2 Tax=Algivirga pacifica TaxID=1162670 RepID=A0ABP9D091_9BACT